MSKTNIAWAQYSWNPYLWRCRKRSPGCQNCYMMTLARRRGQDPSGAFGTRWDAALKELARFPAGAVIFVNSMSDTYYEAAADADVHRVHNTALAHPDKTFLVLTKRPERPYYMRHLLAWPENLWLGVSVESADYLWRIAYALLTGAAHVFVSAEPLLGDVEGLQHYLGTACVEEPVVSPLSGRLWWTRGVEWVIVGGESGPNRRPFDRQWARNIREMCTARDVPFFFKQGSAYKPGRDRLLDGRAWDEIPEAFNAVIRGPTPSQQLALFAAAQIGQ